MSAPAMKNPRLSAPLSESAPDSIMSDPDDFRRWMVDNTLNQNKILNLLVLNTTRSDERIETLELVVGPIAKAMEWTSISKWLIIAAFGFFAAIVAFMYGVIELVKSWRSL